MNLLIINGSPRKKGLISQMLRIFHEQAIASGIEVSEVYANDLQIKPCMGCMVCRTKNACVLPEDDAQRVLALIQQADAIVHKEKDLNRRKDDKTNYGIIDIVVPLFGVQVVVKDACQL